MRITITFTIIILAALSLNCEDNPSYPFNKTNVFESVNILDNELGLQSYIWRDYAPIIPDGGNPLYSSIFVYDINSNAIIEGINADSIWLIHGDEEWSGALEELTDLHTADTLYYSNHEGPKWEPGNYIDVYVRVTYEDEEYYLKQDNIEIDRTE